MHEMPRVRYAARHSLHQRTSTVQTPTCQSSPKAEAPSQSLLRDTSPALTPERQRSPISRPRGQCSPYTKVPAWSLQQGASPVPNHKHPATSYQTRMTMKVPSSTDTQHYPTSVPPDVINCREKPGPLEMRQPLPHVFRIALYTNRRQHETSIGDKCADQNKMTILFCKTEASQQHAPPCSRAAEIKAKKRAKWSNHVARWESCKSTI
jgi:hypothetical protein